MITRQPFSVATTVLVLSLAIVPGVRAGEIAAEAEITFQNDTTTLAGTLSTPPGEGPHPAVILISGSGPQDRDGATPAIPGYHPFKLLADHLSRQGIAVLRFDDRGVGDSTGEYLEAEETAFVKDAEAAFAYLADREGIDARRIGLLGHSEGALIAAMLARREQRVAFVVSLGGPAVKGYDLLLQQARRAAEAEGLDEAEVAQVLQEQRRLFDLVLAEKWDELKSVVQEITLRRLHDLPDEKKALIGDLDAFAARRAASSVVAFRTPRYRFLLTHNAADDWEHVRAPVLALFGELDVQCDATRNRTALEQALQRGGNQRATIKVIPKANHLFVEARTGSMSEYLTLPKDAFVPGLLETISDWIQNTVGQN